jgi:hypothetical protein
MIHRKHRSPEIGSQQGRELRDRRRTCRYPAVIKDALLGWDADGSRVEIPVELVNISINSCLMRSRRGPAPLPGEPIWLKFPEIHPEDWVEGVLVSTDKPFLRSYVIRFQFLALLPFHTFKLLTSGTNGIVQERTDLPEHEMDNFWR